MSTPVLALGTLAQWVDVGYDGGELLRTLLERFPAEKRIAAALRLCTTAHG